MTVDEARRAIEYEGLSGVLWFPQTDATFIADGTIVRRAGDAYEVVDAGERGTEWQGSLTRFDDESSALLSVIARRRQAAGRTGSAADCDALLSSGDPEALVAEQPRAVLDLPLLVPSRSWQLFDPVMDGDTVLSATGWQGLEAVGCQDAPRTILPLAALLAIPGAARIRVFLRSSVVDIGPKAFASLRASAERHGVMGA